MKLRKNVFSYICFAVSAVILSVMTITLITDAIKSLNIFNFSFNNEILNALCMPAISLLFLVVSLLILFLIRFIRIKIIKTYNENSPLKSFFHYMLFVIILVSGIYFRVQNVIFNSNNDSVSFLVRKMLAHERTGVTNSLSYLYLCLISFISKFVGIKEPVFLWTNLVLDILTGIFIYFAFKILFKRIVALFSFAGVMLLSSSYLLVNNNCGLNLLLCMGSFALLMFSILIDARLYRKSSNNIHILWFALLGIGLGYIAYLHLFGSIFWIICLSLIFIFRPYKLEISGDETDDEDIDYPEGVYDDEMKDAIWHKVWLPFALYFIFSVLTFISLIYLDSYVYTLPFDNILWENGYLNILSFSLINRFIPGHYLIEISVLMIVTCFGLLSFLFGNNDDISTLSLALFFLLPIFIFLKDSATFYSLPLCFIGAFFGLGIEFVLFKKPDDKLANNENSSSDDDLIFENISLSEEINKSKEKDINYIENVLPVPKKHIKKELDYAFEPSEEKMKYDIEISDDDDFDL